MLGEKANDVTCDAFNIRYGLNESIPTQFWIYLTDVAQGDWASHFVMGVL